MASAETLEPAPEALNEKELEILRLLAAGHTVKSIAARLGRSETSINERLREARRKTGVGSSRELARALAAQKIWDNKIDLPGKRSPNDDEEQPAFAGHLTSKGTLLMLFAIALAALGIVTTEAQWVQPVAAPPATQSVAASQLPLVGRWSLDISKLPDDGQRPRSVVMDFRVSADGTWHTQAEVVAADGSIQRGAAMAKADGVPVPLTGNMIFADMVSLRQPAPNTLVLTFTKGGVQISSRVYTITEDRQSMKETIIWAGDVSPRTVTTYFNRVG